MEENVGGADQLVRIFVGAVLGLVSLGVLGDYITQLPLWSSPVMGVLALILLATAFTKKCKINELLGRNTVE